MSRSLAKTLLQYANDPMWADHAEVSKDVLLAASLRLEVLEQQADQRSNEIFFLKQSFDIAMEAVNLSWELGHKIYHNANHHEASAIDWPLVRTALHAARGQVPRPLEEILDEHDNE